MLDPARGLSSAVLSAVADLAQRVVAADGGRLKLEWGVLRSRSGNDVEDLLWWDGERLVGFLGVYAFGPPTVELAGMVDPSWRRRGIAGALLDAALPLCVARGYQQALLVTPGVSAPGRAFAAARGAVFDHSEHALVLRGTPTPGVADPRTTLRRATPADADVLARLLTDAFGSPPSTLQERLGSDSEPTLVVEHDGTVVGTLRLNRVGDTGGVYGFAVDPGMQGQGIGRDVLRRVCQQMLADGAQQVGLEVLIENERALRLYTSLGFTPTTTEDYYSLDLAIRM